MLFSSLEFLFAFLPLTWLAWRFCRDLHPKAGLFVLLAASLVFYAGDRPENLALFIIAATITVAAIKAVEHGFAQNSSLLLGVVGLLALLGYFKYAGFVTQTLATLSPTTVSVLAVALPIGISFYVLQGVSCLVDHKRGHFASVSAGKVVLYLAFFPQLIAGPIMRFGQLEPQLDVAVMRQQTALAKGLFLIGLGLACKVLIADKLAPYVDTVYGAPADVSTVAAWCATWAYGLQIYFDFSGYGIIAVGLAALFGVNLPFNFMSPYKAVSVIDFWRRWNVTLSTFLRDYVYRPLGGAELGRERHLINLIVTMLISGLWHGAGWTFVLWGALHGILLAVAHTWRRSGMVAVPRFFSQPLTLALVMLLWLPFRAESIGDAKLIAHAMIGQTANNTTLFAPSAPTLALIAGATLIVFIFPNAAALAERFRHTPLWSAAGGLLLGIALTIQLYAGRAYDFIYFRF